MNSKRSCYSTPPLSPVNKRKHPNLKIITSGISESLKKVPCNSVSEVYPSVAQRAVAERQKSNQKLKENPLKFHDDMEEIMENANLICSFLKTICIGLPISDMSYDVKKNKIDSLENFVVNILYCAKLSSSFVHVGLLFIQRYIKNRIKLQETKNTCDIINLKNKFINKKVYLPTKVVNRLNQHSKRLHNISKRNNKIRLDQRSLNFLLQQSNCNKKVAEKQIENIVCRSSLPKETFIKTQKDLIFAAMIISSKYLDDNSYCNSAWVKLTNKTLKEVFELEREFLMVIDYKVYISDEEWKEWYSWIKHFKELMDIGMSSSLSGSNTSPSSMISVPSQSNEYYHNSISYLPSPVDVTTPTSANFSDSSKRFFTFDEVKEEERRSIYYRDISDSIYFPSLNLVSSFINYRDCCPYSMAMTPNCIPQQKRNVASQQSSYYPFALRNQRNSSSYNDVELSEYLYRMKMEMKRMSFLQKEYYMKKRILERDNEGLNYQCKAINKAIISQAQNTYIDFSEVQRLSQEHNVVFKKPVLPLNSSFNSYDYGNLNLNLNISSNISTNLTYNYFIPPLC